MLEGAFNLNVNECPASVVTKGASSSNALAVLIGAGAALPVCSLRCLQQPKGNLC